MNNTTTYLIIGIIGILVGMVFAVLLTRLRDPNKHDDVFTLTPEQRALRDGDIIGDGADFTEYYEAKIDREQEERTEQLQKEMEEKRMAQVEKDKLRDAEIEEERVLKEEAARIKTELKKWMY